MANTVVSAKTAADTSFEFDPSPRAPITVAAYGLAAGEEVGIEHLEGTNWKNISKDDVEIKLTSTQPQRVVYGPGHCRLNKPITAGAVSLHADQAP